MTEGEADSMTTEKSIGPHRLVNEADDVLILQFEATPTEADARAIIDGEIAHP